METSEEELEGRMKDAAGWFIKDGVLGKIVGSKW